MLRIPAVVAVLGLSVLTLAACASGPSDSSRSASCERPESTASELKLIHSSGAEGTPAVSITAPVYTKKTVFTDVTTGDGPAVTTDAQDVMFTVSVVNGATGEKILSSGTQVQPLSGWRTNYDGFATMMMCATQGSRIVGAVPASALSKAAAQDWGISGTQSIVVALDLQRVYLPAADGVPQYNDRRGMPSVVLAPDGRPGVIIPDAAPPKELAIETLKKGTGPAVTDQDSVRVHYTGVLWADRTVFDSTWEKGASTALTTKGVVPGFAKALEGATVGSQILAVIPPDEGYGDKANGAIPANSTLVFVIDILGIDDPASTPTQ